MDNLKSKISNFPRSPGVYQFLNKNGEVIYVGKAKNLKSRVSQYFGKHDNRTQLPFLMAEATNVTYTVVSSELESAFLENTLIKQYSPKYNIDLKDDKNYAFIKIDYSTEIPQIGYSRSVDTLRRHSEGVQPTEESQGKRSFTPRPFGKTQGALNLVERRMHSGLRMTPTDKYFGPYSATYKIKNTLNLVRKIFPYCAAAKVSSRPFDNAQGDPEPSRMGRPCFYYYMHRCPGVCVGKISLEEYRQTINKIVKFLQGDVVSVARQIQSEMKHAAKQKKFEAAARLRDQLRSLTMLREKQNVILPKKVDWDIVSLASSDDGYACVNLFKIRGGKMFDKENFVYELPDVFRRHSDPERVRPSEGEESLNDNKPEILHPSAFAKASADKSDAPALPAGRFGSQSLPRAERGDDAIKETLQRFLEQYYIETSSIPKIIYLQLDPADPELIKKIIRSRFLKNTKIIIPKKSQPHKLISLGEINAEEYLKNWLSAKAGNLDKINAGLTQLREVLNLKKNPKRIECYDISNTQGTNPVGSMVVFVDGLPAKGQYRKFKIQGKKTPDDFAMMKEVLSRRLNRIKNYESRIMDKDKWPLPDLIVIDGGKGQLGVAVEVLSTLTPQPSPLAIIGLAKRIEEIFLPGKTEPIILDHRQPALQLLQRLRDEAHRFGITFHRRLRSKQAIRSALDDIPGIGPKTKKLLKLKFGSAIQIQQANIEELIKIVGLKLAQKIKLNL